MFEPADGDRAVRGRRAYRRDQPQMRGATRRPAVPALDDSPAGAMRALRSSSPMETHFVYLIRADVIARFEDDHRRLGRPALRIRVEPRVDRDPALPQPITLLPRRTACTHQARLLVRQSSDGVRVRLEVAPPRGMALVPAVHRDRDEVRTVFEVADDDAALLPGLPPDGGEA